MQLAVILLALIIVGLAIGAAFVLATPILAIPILLLAPGPIVTLDIIRRQARQRRIKRFREQARARKTQFQPSDRETVV